MVTYQFQLINLNNRNSDVFKQLESNRSSPGQPCCVFVPMVSNKATSPINVHPHTQMCAYICANIPAHQGPSRTPTAAQGSLHLLVVQKSNCFLVLGFGLFWFGFFWGSFLSSAGLNKRKEISIGWPSFQFLCCYVNSIVQTIPVVLKRGNHWFDLVTRFRKELPPTALGSVKGPWPV